MSMIWAPRSMLWAAASPIIAASVAGNLHRDRGGFALMVGPARVLSCSRVLAQVTISLTA